MPTGRDKLTFPRREGGWLFLEPLQRLGERKPAEEEVGSPVAFFILLDGRAEALLPGEESPIRLDPIFQPLSMTDQGLMRHFDGVLRTAGQPRGHQQSFVGQPVRQASKLLSHFTQGRPPSGIGLPFSRSYEP